MKVYNKKFQIFTRTAIISHQILIKFLNKNIMVILSEKLKHLIPKRSLTAFTERLIDYAGLFPPASLNLDKAFKNYLSYNNGKYSTMLYRFICPFTQMTQLKDLLVKEENGSDKIHISAISSGGISLSDFKLKFESDLRIWNDFKSDPNINADINSLEAKLPEEVFNSTDNKVLKGLIDNITERVRIEISNPVFTFFEGVTDPKSSHIAESVIDSVSNHNLKGINCGFKLRTGGVTADSFPASEEIAYCIRTCLDKKVPMKFTAGLHHPFRHYDLTIGTMMHGFINVFAAGIIAMRHDISNKGIEEILNDEDPEDFIFTDDHFSWKDWKAEINDVEYARKNLVLSFGSCSFDEPVDDLISLNLLN